MIGRSVCYRCHKPTGLCVCADVPRVANRTPIHILQHKRERFHPIGTVRFARLGLERARVLVDDPSDRDATRAQLTRGPAPVGLLYPSPTAARLDLLAPAERPGTLIVLDGTWSHARSLVRDHPWLLELPQYALSPRQASRYRIRAEPFEAAISTIEAITEALAVLEPELDGLDGLVEAFVRMIDRQIELGAQRAGRIRKKRAWRPSRAIPPVLLDAPERLVLVYGELDPRDTEQLVSWCAYRPSDGAVFERWCPRPLSDHHLAHTGLTREHLDRGVDAATLDADWSAFLRPDDVLVAWNQSTLLTRLGARSPSVLLKAAYANSRQSGQSPGAIAQIAAREGVGPIALPFAGRAARILGWVAAILTRLQDDLSRAEPTDHPA